MAARCPSCSARLWSAASMMPASTRRSPRFAASCSIATGQAWRRANAIVDGFIVARGWLGPDQVAPLTETEHDVRDALLGHAQARGGSAGCWTGTPATWTPSRTPRWRRPCTRSCAATGCRVRGDGRDHRRRRRPCRADVAAQRPGRAADHPSGAAAVSRRRLARRADRIGPLTAGRGRTGAERVGGTGAAAGGRRLRSMGDRGRRADLAGPLHAGLGGTGAARAARRAA